MQEFCDEEQRAREDHLKSSCRQAAFPLPTDVDNLGADGLSRHELLTALLLQGLLAKHSTPDGSRLNDALVDVAADLAIKVVDRTY